MKLISANIDQITLIFSYSEIFMISGALGVPNHAFVAPKFLTNVGASQDQIDKLGHHLRSIVEERADYPQYHKFALSSNTQDDARKFSLMISLSKEEIALLTRAFREASLFTKEADSFQTMTGHNWSEAEKLQQELDELTRKLGT